MQIADQKWRVGLSVFLLLAVVGLTATAFARHGEEGILTNRIPEPAPYVVGETTINPAGTAGAFGAPHTGQPFEPLWTGVNDTGGCSGCHTGLYDQWNGAMMSNAWRDPGWRGAFLLVARLTSTDGDCDIPNPPDDPSGASKAQINPFGIAGCQSRFNVTPGTTTPFPGVTPALYSGSGSLMDDFCSRCHMPTNYIDATTNVYADNQSPFGGGTSSQEHGRISPSYDPTACAGAGPLCSPSTSPLEPSPTDPATRQPTPESFGFRTYLDNGATRVVNTNSGQTGIICEVCHTNVETRYTPYHNYTKPTWANDQAFAPTPTASAEYYWAPGATARHQQLPLNKQDIVTEPDTASRNLGYALGAGAFRLSPHALNYPERFGPLTWNDPCALVPSRPCVIDPFLAQNAVVDPYITDVFTGGASSYTAYLTWANPPGKHDTFYQVKFERSEFCAACHDVTNPLTIKNKHGFWAGGFPIERTYTEWQNSRYADRPVRNDGTIPYKRDCTTCHMQQTFGEPGTGLTLYTVNGGVSPKAPLEEPSCDRIAHNPGYSHHFVGGNAYMTKLIGSDADGSGTVSPYPELLNTSFSSRDKNSRFNLARYDNTPSARGPSATQHERFAWDRMRNVLVMSVTAPASATPGTVAPLGVTITAEGSGHNFPTGFPEGRIAWLHLKAWDTRNTANTSDDVELFIRDSVRPAGAQDTLGVGNLTAQTLVDPAYPSTCPDTSGSPTGWKIPEGSPDPYAIQFKAVASEDRVCPTLDLPYATPINLRTTAAGLPADAAGNPVDRANPTRLPQYNDLDGDGDLFDDSFLVDTRLRPRGSGDLVTTVNSLRYPVVGPTVTTSRYSVVIPATGVVGPIAVTAAVYYQAFEAVVAKKFLGNLANLDDIDCNEGTAIPGVTCNTVPAGTLPTGTPTPFLEPCVLKGACDRVGKPGVTGETQLRDALKTDPVVVEGAPPVPMEVVNKVIAVGAAADTVAPRVIINNCKLPRGSTGVVDTALGRYCTGTNLTTPITQLQTNQQYPHWSPSPYGGSTGNFFTEGYGELGVVHNRILKVSFSEPVQECDNVAGSVNCKPLSTATFYITDGGRVQIQQLIDQIDDTTWGLFPSQGADQVFLAGGGYIAHVAPTRNGRAIKDFAGNTLAPGPTTEPNFVGEYTFGFKAQ
ncbi:MAG: hypothetical protein ACOYXR_12805 [Nitrospirota bacterium]